MVRFRSLCFSMNVGAWIIFVFFIFLVIFQRREFFGLKKLFLIYFCYYLPILHFQQVFLFSLCFFIKLLEISFVIIIYTSLNDEGVSLQIGNLKVWCDCLLIPHIYFAISRAFETIFLLLFILCFSLIFFLLINLLSCQAFITNEVYFTPKNITTLFSVLENLYN